MAEPTSKLAYESPDPDRPATAAPTEAQLEQQTPGGSAVAGHDPYAALRHPTFLLFIAGFFVSVIGAQMQIAAARYEIFQKTQSELHMGWIGLALAVPMLLLTLPAGQLADARSRRRIMFITMLASAVCSAAMAWLSYYRAGSVYWIAGMYILLALGATVATLGRPARSALMPQLVPSGAFPNAVTWNASIFESASVLGPAVGGLLIAWSIPFTYVVSALCFAGCTVAIWMLPEPPRTARDESRRPGFADLLVGLRFVWSRKLILGAMTLDLFAVLLGGAVFLLPIFADRILHVGPRGFGLLQAAPSIGAIAMAMIQAHRPPLKRAGHALLYAVAAFGAATIVFGLSRNFWLSFFMLVLTGAFDNISVVVRHTIVQLMTPNEMRGRVSAVNQIFIGSSNELGGLESGMTAYWFGTVPSVVGGGIGTLIVVGLSAILFPQVRKLARLQDVKVEQDDQRGFEVMVPAPQPSTPSA